MLNLEVILKSEVELAGLATSLAAKITDGVIFLDGNLGAGKTTFVRYLLKALGEKSHIKSPTYSIVESYKIGRVCVHHFDLYRLSSAEELEYIDIRNYHDGDSLLIFEWWDKGKGYLPPADLIIKITIQDNQTRLFLLNSQTEKAQMWLENLL